MINQLEGGTLESDVGGGVHLRLACGLFTTEGRIDDADVMVRTCSRHRSPAASAQ
ncbi:hypothetical protein [Jatrophihabitans sp.]|jgi:hypothetical protein|uniref:hypothetical protein n=1 Tax=Jatrophihabitans sp. TaxID=1932789 RepID=UPI002F0971CB